MIHRTAVATLYFVLLALGGVEALTYSGVVENKLLLPLWVWFAAGLSILAAWRLLFRPCVQNWWLLRLNNWGVLPITAALLVLTFGLDTYNYTNYVFSTFGINHHAFIELLLLSVAFCIITASLETLKKLWPVFLLSLFLLIVFFLYVYEFEFFLRLSANYSGADDDNFMEWLQVYVLGVGVFSALLLSVLSRQLVRRMMSLLVGGVLFLLAAEELSWGQRILDISYEAGSGNYQNELNLHNQEGVNELLILLYIAAFVYALGSWLVRKQLQKRSLTEGKRWWVQFLTFRGTEVWFFVPTLIFNPYGDRAIGHGLPSLLDLSHEAGITPEYFHTLHLLAQWRETFEVVFYAGIVLHVLGILFVRLHELGVGNRIWVFLQRGARAARAAKN